MPTFPDDALVCRRTTFARRNQTFNISASLRCHISDVMAALCGVSDHHHDQLPLFIAGTLAHIRIDHIPCVVTHDYTHRSQLDILLLQPAGAPIQDSSRLVHDFGCCARSARAFPPQHVSRTPFFPIRINLRRRPAERGGVSRRCLAQRRCCAAFGTGHGVRGKAINLKPLPFPWDLEPRPRSFIAAASQ
jgi:hypothetical protein